MPEKPLPERVEVDVITRLKTSFKDEKHFDE